MLRKTHMAVGVAASLVLMKPQSVSELVITIGAGTIGSLVSDIDIGTSGSSKDADKVIAFLFAVTATVLALDYFLNMGIILKIINNSNVMQLTAGLFIFASVCAYGRIKPHRSFMHSFAALIALNLALGLIWSQLIPCFTIGFLSHIAIDLFNKKKVRVLYPMKEGISLGIFKSDGLVNYMMFAAGYVIIAAYIIETLY